MVWRYMGCHWQPVSQYTHFFVPVSQQKAGGTAHARIHPCRHVCEQSLCAAEHSSIRMSSGSTQLQLVLPTGKQLSVRV